jgi:hypothetical protein
LYFPSLNYGMHSHTTRKHQDQYVHPSVLHKHQNTNNVLPELEPERMDEDPMLITVNGDEPTHNPGSDDDYLDEEDSLETSS